jgi:nucleotide-binding universal stress UspA family protein
MFRKLLIATDLTAKSHNALHLSLSLAQWLSAELFVLHVVPLPGKLKRRPTPIIQDSKSSQLILRNQIAEAEAGLANQLYAMRQGSNNVHLLVKPGDPIKTIAKVAKELGIDLIVIGRGSGGKLGLVTEQIVRLAGQTVLVAPVKLFRVMNAFLKLPIAACPASRLRAGSMVFKSGKNK